MITRRSLIAGVLALPTLARPAKPRELAVTIDDFNWQNIPQPWSAIANRALLDTLEGAGIRTALFVIGRNLEEPEGRTLLAPWSDARHLIGNHTYSHRSFHSVTPAEFEADTDRCGAVLKRFSRPSNFFRFPLLKEGDTAAKRDELRRYLNQRGLRNGHVTVDASDWFYDAQLRKRLEADPAYDVSRFREPYLAHMVDRADYYDRLAVAAIGRSPRHTLLLHYNLINVLFLGDALRRFTASGWRLVSAQNAYGDPVFQSAPQTVPAGESLIWALAKESGKFESQLRYPGEDDIYESAKVAAIS